MKATSERILNEGLSRNNLEYFEQELRLAVEESVRRIKAGGKVLVCGNGGSAADSGHIVGELLKGFCLPRRLTDADKKKFSALGKDGERLAEKLQYGIPAVALTGSEAISTAVMNDNGAEMVFAQQAFGLATDKDIFIGISTSGNAENVSLAMRVAKTVGAFSIALCGKTGGRLKELADVAFVVRENETYKIQEKHLPLYHLYCLALENELFGE